MTPAETGIDFTNNLSYNESFNPYTFRNFFNGGGVAIGDIDNDSLPDIFFCSNQQSNRLYRNRGGFQFEDITVKAGVGSAGVWSTGVTMADVNGDGWLDIYVCKSGDMAGERRANELFLNNRNGTFTEQGKEWGLDIRGLSTHAAFLDYDNDGDLDCYILSNSFRSVANYEGSRNQRNQPDTMGGNRFLRNDGGHFTDVTKAAGIFSSAIGFGLGVTISDLNRDGWQDIYVSNDFFERDYLYINQRNGRFAERLEQTMGEISMNAMGADIADVDNDGLAEVYVTDMLPEAEARLKTKTAFENWDKYEANQANGFHRQFVRNTLQWNRGAIGDTAVAFTDVGRYAGVEATDWSWGALIFDMDNDGNKDIFVANGIYKDITDQDYIQFTASAENDIRKQILNKEENIIKRLIDLIPSVGVSNYAFCNVGGLRFEDRAGGWGLSEPSFSNGSAYGDLDGDGDLDLVVNNVNMPCFVYQNQARQQLPGNNYLSLSLQGIGANRYALGAKVSLYHSGTLCYQELMPMRGFQSSVDTRLVFGIGQSKTIDSLVVEWPAGGGRTVLRGIAPNQHLGLAQSKAGTPTNTPTAQHPATPLFASFAAPGLSFLHRENPFVDFDREKLLFHMRSTSGPHTASGDVNGDGLTDLYFCGAKGSAGSLLVQGSDGSFRPTNQSLLALDAESEEVDALFFDCDGDGDVDLYVCSGGVESPPHDLSLLDRLYLNDGRGTFSKSPQALPTLALESTSCVRGADWDGDGDVDLFVGVGNSTGGYGLPCRGYLLQNDGKGHFKDITRQAAPELMQTGMIRDGQWLDWNGDGFLELLVAGEYMPLTLLHNKGGKKLEGVDGASIGLAHTSGWWNRLHVADLNGDGLQDVVALNHGENSRFRATAQKPVELWVGDFDGNGGVEQLLTGYNGERSYPVSLRHDVVGVLPYLKKKYLRYADYAGQGITDMFTAGQLGAARRLVAEELRSVVLLSGGRGKGYRVAALPMEAQLSVMYGVWSGDVDGDGVVDLVLGGNLYQSKPEAGIYDGSYGCVLKGDGRGGFRAVDMQHSGLMIRGAVRDITHLTTPTGTQLLLFTKNNAQAEVVQVKRNKASGQVAQKHQ